MSEVIEGNNLKKERVELLADSSTRRSVVKVAKKVKDVYGFLIYNKEKHEYCVQAFKEKEVAYVSEKCIQVGNLYVIKGMAHTRVTLLNEENKNYAKELACK